MEAQIITCPSCKTQLNVGDGGGKSEMVVTCPKCGIALRVRFQSDADDPQTTFLHKGATSARSAFLEYNGLFYEIKQGSNIIGRAAPTSRATLQIATDDRRMSRQHACIVLHRFSNDMLKAVLGYADEKATIPIFLNNERLYPEDQLVLKPGDVLRMGKTIMNFRTT